MSSPSHKVLLGDSLELMRTIPSNSVQSIVTDPPYGISFLGAAWDRQVPGPEYWREALRVAVPGAHLLAFASPRNYHRLAVAIEDAGWEVRDMVGWVYAAGFPKGRAVDKAIDAVAAKVDPAPAFVEWARGTGVTRRAVDEALREAGLIKPSSSMSGHYFGLSQPAVPTPRMWEVLRPLFGEVPEWVDEFVRRPETERPVVGAAPSTLGGTVAAGPRRMLGPSRDEYLITAPGSEQSAKWAGWNTTLKPAIEPIVLARKPLDGGLANNILKYGTGGLNVGGCRVPHAREVDLERTAVGKIPFRDASKVVQVWHPDGLWPANLILEDHPVIREAFGTRFEFFYSAKASGDDLWARIKCSVGCPYHGSAVPLRGAEASSRDPAREAPDGFCRECGEPREHVSHTTVKPTSLMQYLCRLVTPPGGTVLDPFCGSGSTGVGAVREGFSFLGMDREEDFYTLSSARGKDALPDFGWME